MTTSIKISSASEAAELIEHTRAVQEAERSTPSPASTSLKIAGYGSLAVRDGETSIQTGRAVKARVEGPRVPEGHVRLTNNMITTYEAAKAAGATPLIVERGEGVPRGDSPSPNGGDGSKPSQAAPKEGTTDATEPDAADTLSGVTEEQKAQITKGSKALEASREAIGAYAVDSMQQDAVASGNLPGADELPEGVTTDMVDAVVEGYEAQANVVLGDTGASVNALRAMLNENELREARRATFQGDDATLKRLGREAMRRLERLPNDPAMMQAIEETWPADHKVVHRDDGTAWLETPHYKMPWAKAVKQGLIRY